MNAQVKEIVGALKTLTVADQKEIASNILNRLSSSDFNQVVEQFNQKQRIIILFTTERGLKVSHRWNRALGLLYSIRALGWRKGLRYWLLDILGRPELTVKKT